MDGATATRRRRGGGGRRGRDATSTVATAMEGATALEGATAMDGTTVTAMAMVEMDNVA